MKKIAFTLYALLSYGIGLSSLVYMIGFLSNFYVPKGIDTGVEKEIFFSLPINILLATAYFLVHSMMARPRFKEFWVKIIPEALERSTYILVSGLSFYLLVLYWQPITTPVWTVQNSYGQMALLTLYLMAWGAMLFATFNIDHLSFFGLRQAWARFWPEAEKEMGFSARYLYRFARHPISLCWFLVLWISPSMTVGHLILSVIGSVYILFVTPIEEKDLTDEIGEPYKQYTREVRRFMPIPKRISHSQQTYVAPCQPHDAPNMRT